MLLSPYLIITVHRLPIFQVELKTRFAAQALTILNESVLSQ